MSTPAINTTVMTVEQMQAEIARLSAANAKLSAPKKERFSLGNGLSCSVSEKGAVSIYGIHTKFPVTLYRNQLEKLFVAIPGLQAFINENSAKLSSAKPALVK